MATPGIDYSFARPRPQAIKAAGYSFVCRYLSVDNTSTHGKILFKPEADALRAAGLDIVSTYEYTADGPLSGRDRGASDARVADQQARDAGMPAGRPIYFAVDFDATEAQQGAINAYFDGVASVIGRNRTGAYAGYYVVKRLFDAGKISWGWQTFAWSGGQWDPRAQLRQTRNGIKVDGQDCDEDQGVAADFGQWSAQGQQNRADMPLAGHWNGGQAMSVGVYRPTDRTFYLRYSNSAGVADETVTFGDAGDLPICGVWRSADGGATQIGVYRPGNRTFYLRHPAGDPTEITFGDAEDLPITGDWRNTGVTEIGVYRRANSTFYLRYNENTTGQADETIPFGDPGDVPITGKWDDGGVGIGVYRPGNSRFYLRKRDGSVQETGFGNPGEDVPVVGVWNGNPAGIFGIGVYRLATATFYLSNDNTKGVADATFVYGNGNHN